MRGFDPVFSVDGQPLLVPDGPVELTFSDLDAASAGRDEAGYMHRLRVRSRVRTWGFTYSVLTAEELAYLEETLGSKATFPFAFDGGQTTAYCSKQEVRLYDRTRGIYKALKFDIIEC